jgi:L-alanine-DL-glutamate epimerase-like enolase superfamily enzyme
MTTSGPLTLHAQIESWPLIAPFRITGRTWETLEVLVVQLTADRRTGRGEAAGVYYKKDSPASMLQQIEKLRSTIECGVTRESIQSLLPPGGARNALDCALWDLEARLSGQPAWRIAGLARSQPLLTTFSCGADTPENMARAAKAYGGARAIKIKLTGEPVDADRIRAIRDACPNVWLGIDGNQGFTREMFESLLPVLVQLRVELIEQPFPMGQDAWLDGFHSPIPLAADESVQSLADLPKLAGRFQVVNIKLDKCGGLTEGLAMAHRAREFGLDCMVGNMLGTSLAMAPAYLVGQLCRVVDLDGPIFLKSDRAAPVCYSAGMIECSSKLWGS